MKQQTIKMYGAQWCPDCRRAKQFFGDQRVLYDWINVDDKPDSMKYVEQVNGGKQIIPTIVFEDASVLTEPTNAELAEKLGIQPKATRQYFEVIIIGSGPAGLTAAIYAAREGFDTLVIDRIGVGGQTGVTERIDNYPGFPDGVGGAELAGPAQDSRRALRC
ncbi:MAG: FAD-binding protein [SAR202 cluster bacterium]|nr:FAD-binding protein [SAR202 cluster bacterium]